MVKEMRKMIRIALGCVIFAVFAVIFSVRSSALTTYSENFEQIGELSTTNSPHCANCLHLSTTMPSKSHDIGNSVTTLASKDGDFDEIAQEETIPEEYGEFIGSLPDDVIDLLPDDAFSSDPNKLLGAAQGVSGAGYLLRVLLDSFGGAVGSLLPTLALLCGIIVLSAVCHAFASSIGGGMSAVVSFAARLVSFCAISASATSSLSRLSDYFESLFAAVASFLPLSAVLYAAGGNLTAAASGTLTLNVILSVCQFIFTKTVLPVFSLCLSMSLLSVFDGASATAAQSISSSVKKWYTTALAFVMMILTTALTAQTILSAKADNAAMKGMKLAASSFIPVSGGTVSSTLGTLAASVELVRGAVGIVGVVVILLLLIPIIVELALLRAVFSLASFLAGLLGCSGENKLLSEIGSLYGYLEGVAVLSSVVFIIAFAIFAATCSAVG
jgi:stage III sporulation protein AE